ncbi:putative transcription factor C2H2 family [Helianthus annuus]|uniref:Putative pex, Zinc finger, RING/FYVE/PHD-type n=1 Tax=Helianthus annuus TaxID=4232 RepID=A0A251UVH2_HELAN|nr:peroxisome biogenesis protein 2 [Helianthus annuus]KAF5808054.1 putative transcription factor C2H2 family [Helianthus annuus]KAJ0595236.1 putative transcription factor C2H2 family [Helianthus annuus]KAJ0759698.1 putative transcription factor C2H2 family [Helianthus annuus]KAJ0924796.1 putative transcription factor C2H2 family [Helianthus annuus]
MRETLASTSSSTSPATASGGVPPAESAWITTCERISPRWQSFALPPQAAIPIVISRVNQVDAARLDVEMSAMLKEQLVKVFSVMKPGLLFQYEAELDACLEFLIWRFSIWVDKPTPGNALMNLRYRDERAIEMREKVRTGLEGPGLTMAQKIWYCIATVGGQYIWTRLQSFSAFRRWGDSEQRSVANRAWYIIQRIEGFYKAASFTNLLIFLYTGRYRNLIERALRARLVYGSPHMNRAVSFEYMNRQLVWNEFSEMLLLLLPILNSASIKSIFRPFSKDKSSGSTGDETQCPICHINPTIGYVALPCQHRYCYYCLRTRCAATTSFRCSRCSEPVVAMQRHGSINT